MPFDDPLSKDGHIYKAMDELAERLIKAEIYTHEALQELERLMIIKALSKFKGNQSMASRHLKIHRNTLTDKIKRYRIKYEHNVNSRIRKSTK